MKKILSTTIAILLVALTLIGCGKDMGRLNYNYDMSEYVKLDSYAIEVDKSSDAYKKAYKSRLEELLKVKKKDGVVADKDVVNINYVGKKDGVAFEGGTANGYDLTIGSDTFIDGFEDGLIGVEVGKTVDLNLTFPSNYNNEELKGKAVVFTVTVNYITSQLTELNEDALKYLEHKTVADAEKAVTNSALEDVAWNTIFANASVIKRPTKEEKLFLNEQLNFYEQTAKNYSMTLEQFAFSNNMTLKQLKEYVKENIANQMADAYAIFYYIIDKAGVAITDEKVDEMFEEMGKQYGESVDKLGISEKYVEAEAVTKIAYEIVRSNITSK